MKALVVESFENPPLVGDFPDPKPSDAEQVVKILAAGVHPIVRALARGSHYGSHGRLPFIPGVDAVAQLADGSRAYVGYARAPYGTMSELTVIPKGWTVPIPGPHDGPEATSSAVIAGTLNPLAAVWMALKLRADLQPGARVLVLGATGISGQLAIPLAREMGAAEIIAVGRNTEVLDRLAADHNATTIALHSDRAADTAAIAAAVGDGVDVVLDYLWGSVAEVAVAALVRPGLASAPRETRWVQVGEMAGSEAAIPAAALRSSGLLMTGSGAGSVDPKLIAAAIPALLDMVVSGKMRAPVRAVPLAGAAEAWRDIEAPGRLVIEMPSI